MGKGKSQNRQVKMGVLMAEEGWEDGCQSDAKITFKR